MSMSKLEEVLKGLIEASKNNIPSSAVPEIAPAEAGKFATLVKSNSRENILESGASKAGEKFTDREDILSPDAKAFLNVIRNHVPCKVNLDAQRKEGKHYYFQFDDGNPMNKYALTIENIENGLPELLRESGYRQEGAFTKNETKVNPVIGGNYLATHFYVSRGAMEAIMAKYHIVEKEFKSTWTGTEQERNALVDWSRRSGGA